MSRIDWRGLSWLLLCVAIGVLLLMALDGCPCRPSVDDLPLFK